MKMTILTESIVQTDFLYIEGFKNGLQVGVKKCFEEGFDKGLKKGIKYFIPVIKRWQKGMKVSMISDFLGIPVEEVELIIAEFQEFQKLEVSA